MSQMTYTHYCANTTAPALPLPDLAQLQNFATFCRNPQHTRLIQTHLDKFWNPADSFCLIDVAKF